MPFMSTTRYSCISLAVHAIRKIVAATALIGALGTSAWAGPCPGQQQAIEILRSRIKADQDNIRRLNIGITASQLQDAVDMSEEGRKKAILAAALSLVDGFLMAPEAALGEQSIADYELKN